MKSGIIAFLVFLLTLVPADVAAQTKPATGSSAKTELSAAEEKQIQQLKEKIATKVAELREKNNKAVSGTIIEITANTIRLKAYDDAEYTVRLDETLTQYFRIAGGQKKETRMADLQKGTYIIVSGVIQEKKIDANFVYIDESHMAGSGKIVEVNKTDYYMRVVTNDKDTVVLDIENYTKRFMVNIKTLAFEQIGFSKIKEGDSIHFVVKKTGGEKENRYSAQKLLIIPQEYFIK